MTSTKELLKRVETEGVTQGNQTILQPGQYNASTGVISNSTNGINLPVTSPSTAGTNGVGGMIDYWKTQYQTSIQQQKDDQAKIDAQKAIQATETKSLKERILGTKSPEQIRTEATTTTGINPTNYFADEQASIAELDTLNTEYNKTVAQRDQQIASATGVAGQSIDFMNNQIAQITRNAAPVLNNMAANINSKAATFEAKQNRFNEAKNYINQAVQNATADQKYNMDMYDYFYNENQDIIDRLDTKVQNAYKESQTAAQNAWELAVDEKTAIGELMMNNPNAGISINDTQEQAMAKIAKSGGTAAYQLQLAQERRLGTETSETIISTNVNDILQDAIDQGATPAAAARAAAAVYEGMGIQATQKDLNKWTTQASGLTKTIVPEEPKKPKPLIISQKGFEVGQKVREEFKGIPAEAQKALYVPGLGEAAAAVQDFFVGLFSK